MDSATARKMYGEQVDWTDDRELLAGINDRLGELIWLFIEAHKKQGVSNPLPEPIPRPKSRKPKSKHRSVQRRHATVAEMKRFFGVPAKRGGKRA